MIAVIDLDQIINILEANSLVSNYELLKVDEISTRIYYKIRCNLIPSYYKLDIKYIKTESEFIYAYQVFYKEAIVRWDNAPHYPGLDNSPHHFHNKDNIVSGSELDGEAMSDLKRVLEMIPGFLE